MKAVRKLILQLDKKLQFLSKKTSPLKNIYGFETFIRETLTKISILELTEKESGQIQALKKLFLRFDSASESEKRTSINEALERVRQFSIHEQKTASSVTTTQITQEKYTLNDPVSAIKGVGPKKSALFLKLGISTLKDMLLFLPTRYEDKSSVEKIADLQPGKKATVNAYIHDLRQTNTKFGKKVFEAILRDETGTLSAKWFRFKPAYFGKKLNKDHLITVCGEPVFNRFSRKIEMVHPNIETPDKQQNTIQESERILPVYNLTEGLDQKLLRTVSEKAVQALSSQHNESLPASILKKYKLPEWNQAISNVHYPGDDISIDILNSKATRSHKRLIFDEFFTLELALARKKEENTDQKNAEAFSAEGDHVKSFYEIIPFTLTAAQKSVIKELMHDLQSGKRMNRLLQGDVGSGKTVVAIFALLAAVDNGFQAAIMVPTEILAEQHFKNISTWLKPLGITPALLTGSAKPAERKKILTGLQSGVIKIVVGTHSLIQDDLTFKSLKMVVIDEQHRFGVLQRSNIVSKGAHVHVLIMTATPIPRTLTMTAYGDLDLSVIDELPKGRKAIKTVLFFGAKGNQAYPIIEKEVQQGRQVYIVCPLVEKSENLDLKAAVEMADLLQTSIFPGHSVGLVHGKMKNKARKEIMSRFRNGEISILVTTTIVEVGVDIPNATVMMIEHAERFGLSQLHQLRGRIGRGTQESTCILVGHYPLSEEGKKRLRVITQSQDGFYLAEQDLEIRGPGEFLGTKQSGMAGLRLGNIVRDHKILEAARKEAFALIQSDPDLKKPENLCVRNGMDQAQKNLERFSP